METDTFFPMRRSLSNIAAPADVVTVEVPRAPAPFRIHKNACKRRGYRLIQLAGRGMVSSVYQAENLREVDSKGTPAKEAVKVYEWQLMKGDYQRIELARLLLLYKQMPYHPNILRIRKHFSDGDAEYAVTEWCPLGSLAWVVRPEHGVFRRGMAEDSAREIFLQICSGLQHLHCHGVPHGHLTCENVVVDKDYGVKLADYGHVPAACNVPTLSPVQLLYTAPELLQKQPFSEFAGDVWSLGVVLYTILNGGTPYSDDDLQKASAGHGLPALVFRSSLSYLCTQFVRRILTYTPFMRPTLKELLEDPWIVGGNPPMAETLLGKPHLAKCERERLIRRRLRDLESPRTRFPGKLYQIYHTVGIESMKFVETMKRSPTPFQHKPDPRPPAVYLPGTTIPIVATIQPDPVHPKGKLLIGAPQPRTWRQAYDSMLCVECRRKREQSKDFSALFPTYTNTFGKLQKTAPRLASMMSAGGGIPGLRRGLSLEPDSPRAPSSSPKNWEAAVAQSEKTRKDFFVYYGGTVPATCTEFPVAPVTVMPMKEAAKK